MVIWLSFLAFFSVMNETVFNVVLPDIAKQFHISPAIANWVNTGFILPFAIGSVIYSNLSNRFGVKKLFLFGLSVYNFGSFLGFLSSVYLPFIIIARILQGVGASAIPALMMVIITRYVKKETQGKAFGLIGSFVALGEGIGPAIGGLMANHIHWAFLFLVPTLTLCALPFLSQLLPEEPSLDQQFDVFGAVLLSLAITMFTLFLSFHQLSYMLFSLCCYIGFMLRILHTKHPFIDPKLLLKKRFILSVLAGCILLGTVAGFISMIPYMVREIFQKSTDVIGVGVLLPGTISVVLFGMIGGLLVDKFGKRSTLYLGLAVMVTSLLLLSVFVDFSVWFVTVMTIFTFGSLSFIKTAISATVSAQLADHEAGEGMGILNFACFLAEGIGIAMVGSFLTKPLHKVTLPLTHALPTANLYSNLLLLLALSLILGGILYGIANREKLS